MNRQWFPVLAGLVVIGGMLLSAAPASAQGLGFSMYYGPSYSYGVSPYSYSYGVPSYSYYASPAYVPAPVYPALPYRSYYYGPYTSGYPVFTSPRVFGYGPYWW